MTTVTGNITPSQAGRVPLQRALNAGIWNMEYVLSKAGAVVDSGSFNADTDGDFTLEINAPEDSTLKVRCLGGWGYETAEVEVDIDDPTDHVDCGTLVMREK